MLFVQACGNKKPTANLVADPTKVKLGQEVTFTDNSTNANRLLWNFGDGIERNDSRTQKYAYSKPGTYTAVLTVWNKKEKKEASTTKPIVVEPPTKDDILGVWFYYFVQDVKQWETFTTEVSNVDVDLIQIFDAFKGMLIASGWQPITIDQHIIEMANELKEEPNAIY